MVTSSDIVTAFRSLGVQPGDALVAHGSLKSFGTVDGGAPAVARALLEAVGPAGLATMPVYAESVDEHGDLLRAPRPGEKVSTGAIPAAFGALPEVVMAAHPLYAYGYYGSDAERLARTCERLLVPYGTDQPLHILFGYRGKIVQLGTDDVTNTAIHVAEEVADPEYLAAKKSVSQITIDAFFALPVEQRRAVLRAHQTGPRRDFRTCTPLIEAAGVRRAATVGGARVMVTDFTGMCEVLIEALRKNPRLMIKE